MVSFFLLAKFLPSTVLVGILQRFSLVKGVFIVKSLEYGKYYSRLELTAAKFEDLEEETNSGH